MSRLTFSQIEEIITSPLFADNDNGPRRYFHDDFCDAETIDELSAKYPSDYPTEFIEKIKLLGKVVKKDSYDGEGRGDEYWKVYEFVDHGVYIKFDGWYASHHGSEYEEMFKVFPCKVKTIKWVPTC